MAKHKEMKSGLKKDNRDLLMPNSKSSPQGSTLRKLDSTIRDRRHANLERLMHEAPRSHAAPGLSIEQTNHVIDYAIMLAERSIDAEKTEGRLTINSVVSEAIKAKIGDDWELVEICDARRNAEGGSFRIGQVDLEHDTSLLGYWTIRNTTGEKSTQQIFFKVTTQVEQKPEITTYQGTDIERTQIERKLLLIGPQSWKLSVPAHSDLAKWLIELSGAKSLGWIDTYDNLGYICKAIVVACEAYGVSHLLLPVQRRDHGDPDSPLLFTDLIKLKDGHFAWSDHAMVYGKLSHVHVEGNLIVEILLREEVMKRQKERVS